MRRSRLVAGGLVLVTAGSLVLAWRLQHRGPSQASVSSAIDDFRASSTTAPQQSAARVPAAGVYVYTGSGREALSFLSTRQQQGPTEPATVTHTADGCWQFRIAYNSFHDQTWNRCASGSKVLESGGSTDQRFDFVAFSSSEHNEVTCAPPFVVADPDAAPGTVSPVRCSGRSKTTNAEFTQTGTATFVGRETLTVGTTPVQTVHTRENLRMTGGQTGTVHIDVWFAVADGLPVQESHTIHVESPAPAPIGHVSYDEAGNFHLTSLTPQT